MLLKEFPNLQWLKKQAESGFSVRLDVKGKPLPNAGWPTVILNAKTSHVFRDNIQGPLSIFANLSGQSAVECDGKRSVVNPGFFFVTNHDQRYTLQVEKVPTETCNIHFGEHFAEQVLSALSKTDDQLVRQEGFSGYVGKVNLYNKLYRAEQSFGQDLKRLQLAEGSLEEEEILFEILSALLKKDQHLKQSAGDITTIKKSTREELLKRLFLATDYIYSYYDKDLSLEEIAAVSCLSKFHFLRLFKLVFRQTPYQFINALKIEKAKELLRGSTMEINEVASSLGFSASSTFSRLFYNQVRVYPSQFRAQLK